MFARRIEAWLAEDVDAYVACWHDDMRIEMPSGVIEGAAKYRKLVEASFAWAAPVSFDVHHLAVDDGHGHRVRRLDDPRPAPGRRRARRVARALGVRAPRRPDRVVARASPRTAGPGRRLTSVLSEADASGYDRAGSGRSISARNLSTASLNAFGVSAIRPCAAPRST